MLNGDGPCSQARLTINELKQQQMGLTGVAFPGASPSFGAPAPPMVAGPPLAPPVDPWAPTAAPRTQSPWGAAPLPAPPPSRHTPNPFLS